MKAIERNSNYLHPHGSYITDWRDERGPIWEVLCPIHEAGTHALLRVAYMVQEKDSTFSELMNSDNDYFHWLKVGNKEFVIYYVDDIHVYAVANFDGTMCIIRGNFVRIIGYDSKRRETWVIKESRLAMALELLSYDLNDNDLRFRCM